MEIIYVLIPLALVLVAIIVWAFFWAIRSGQFDDLEGPAHRILMDDDEPPRASATSESQSKNKTRESDNGRDAP